MLLLGGQLLWFHLESKDRLAPPTNTTRMCWNSNRLPRKKGSWNDNLSERVCVCLVSTRKCYAKVNPCQKKQNKRHTKWRTKGNVITLQALLLIVSFTLKNAEAELPLLILYTTRKGKTEWHLLRGSRAKISMEALNFWACADGNRYACLLARHRNDKQMRILASERLKNVS